MRPSESGRSYISKGFLKQAKKCANKNVLLYHPLISEKTPLLGIEPSAIYTFLDEYPKLSSFPKESKELASNCHLIDSFLAKELQNNNIQETQFHTDAKEIKVHAHCYQKALGNPSDTFKILNLPKNYNVRMLKNGWFIWL